MFKNIDLQKSLTVIEKEQIEYWNINKIFEQSIQQNQNKEKFVFFDGPPFANGLPHYGHILAQSLKDAITRYQTMQGKYVPRTNGWDCHGLPVEYEIEKELQLSGHKDIINFGIENFNQKCKESVFKYTQEWNQLFERLGRWYDKSQTYATLENSYMESIWWVFKQIWNKDLVYKGYKVMHVCPRCETSLSNFEVSQGYKNITDLSAVAKFKLKKSEKYLLAWTTTPWTLPGNQALAINKNIEYVEVEFENEILILAKSRVEEIFKNKSHKIIKTVDPNELINQKYTPLFNYYEETQNSNFIILDAEFVTTEDGTGIVHIAGGYGEDDYNLCLENNLKPIQHIKIDGTFDEDIEEYAGKFFKGQDQNICKQLENENKLLQAENYKHSYPHCWRDDTPLLNYCMDAWFIKVTEIKDKLIRNNQAINWQPKHIQNGRFGQWLENVKDWNISRNRFWGCPLPIWENPNSDHKECISSIQELRLKAKPGNKIIFVRHGHSDHNEKGILSCNLHSTSNLTEKGIEQIKEVAKKLKDNKVKIDLIIASPFSRTLQTAEIINKNYQVEILINDKIREYDCGDLDGQKFEVQSEEIINSNDPLKHKTGKRGESLNEVQERMLEFLDQISSEYSNKNILVVSHGGPITLTKNYLENKEVTAETIKSLAYLKHDEYYEFEVGNVPTNENKLDLHKPYIDFVKIECPIAKSQGKSELMNRVKEVFDCWFESGAMPYAQIHYPFENKEEFEKNFPADFIAEGLDQTRGWFYTLHVLSTILFDKPAFKNIIVNGILLSANGEKLSKRKKNYPDPHLLFESKGVDALRLFLYQSTTPIGEDARFSDIHVDEVLKKFILTLYNTYNFFATYSNIDKFNPDIEPEFLKKDLHELDKWIISELHQLIKEVTINMNEYNFTKATRPLIGFIDSLSNWYIRRSRRRFWKSENDQDKKFAYQTLYYVLCEFCKLIAPFTPFISDVIFRNLTNKSSVHLEDWPKYNSNLIDFNLNEKMSIIQLAVSLGHSIRSKENIKVRQPLQKVRIAAPNKKQKAYILELQDIILEELNIKELEIIDNPTTEVKIILKPKAKELGPIIGSQIKEIIQACKENNFTIKDQIVDICSQQLSLNSFDIQYQSKQGYSAESQNGLVVIINTKITPQLKQEGLVRDLVRVIQEFRKELNYNVSDRIHILIKTENEELDKAILKHANYIKKETLAIELQNSGELNYDSEKLVEIENFKIIIAIKRVDLK